MSGIVGVVNFDGCPVDAALLRRLTGQLNRWGTEGQQCAIIENAQVIRDFLQSVENTSFITIIWMRIDTRRAI